ncbi:hypothetical protein WA026_023178 [Henosepilachna vigintioctopunctata]|uniref:Uncharacterized protein n=1 Tax=Henosepilachna vigintioctopunctata TaxID=420089 RepID=A0AAW1UPU3_9CUCU
MHRMQEIMDYSLEDLWQDYNELLIQFEQDPESVDTPGFLCSVLNKKEQYHQPRQTSLSQDVDNKVDQENNETVEQSDKEDEEQPFNNHSTDPYFKMHRMQEIMDYSLEDLWQDYNELLIQFEQDPESVDTPAETDNLSTFAE